MHLEGLYQFFLHQPLQHSLLQDKFAIPNAVMSAGGLLCVNVIGLYSGWNNMGMMEEPDTVNNKIQNHWYK